MSQEKIPLRKEISDSDKWNLTPLFENNEQWEKLFKETESKIEIFDKYRGKLHVSNDHFTEALLFDEELYRDLEKIYVFSHLKNDEDKSDQQYLAMYQRSMNLYTRISEASSFLSPEIQEMDNALLEKYKKDDRLKDYQFYLEKIIRNKPHTLSKEIERILAMSGEVASAASQIFSQLDNADLKFGMITDEEGKEIELSHGNFVTFLMKRDDDLRKKSFKQYYQVYDDHKNSIAAALNASNKKDAFYAKVRNFPSSRESSLFSDDVPVSVYDNLIETVKKNTGPLFEYFRVRKEKLKLDELHFYDSYVPIIETKKFHMPYEEAVETCVKALEPLGEEYCSILKDGLLNGWVDRYENKGKRSGAYSSGCYDSPPYILMNYREDNINSLYTLIHEAGHSMHSLYSAKNQPYISHDYTIFVAEVASTFNETLLGNYLLKLYENDPQMKAYIINREIDNIRGTLYRQTMFAEFEKLSHEVVENNEALTLERIQDIYGKLLKEYFGDSVVIDDELTLEALRIPHFYSAFYVYKYATGISAAIALADKVTNGGEKDLKDYLSFLKLGGSMFPIEELKVAGVDMSQSEPIEKALAHFKDLVDELKKVL